MTFLPAPEDGSIINFIPDSRYATVHFNCYRDSKLTATADLPFIGWAIIVSRHHKDLTEYSTRLVAVGLNDEGEPVTADDIARYYDIYEGQVMQTKLFNADGSQAKGVVTELFDRPPFQPTHETLGPDDL